MADLFVANEIIRQMGGPGRLSVMIGAKQFLGGEDGVQFKWKAKSRDGSNTVKIRLTAADDYELTFYRIRGVNVTETKKYDGIYADRLVDTFEKFTGLYLRL